MKDENMPWARKAYLTNQYKTEQILHIGILHDVGSEVFWKRRTVTSSSLIVLIFRGHVVIEHKVERIVGDMVDSTQYDLQTGIEGGIGRKSERSSDGTRFILDILAI
jgi:hypothetical protein